MCPAVHRINTPVIAGTVVFGMADTIHDGVTHVDIRGCHVDFSAQAEAAVRVFALAHFLQQLQRFGGRTITPRRVFAFFGQGATVETDLFGRLLIYVSMTSLYQT